MENTYSFFATLNANVFINDDDFSFLLECMKHHYDLTIKMSVEIGGFMYGLNNRRTINYRDVDNDDRNCDLSNRELQLILKSLEMQNSIQSTAIKNRFRNILSEMTLHQNNINTNILKQQ